MNIDKITLSLMLSLSMGHVVNASLVGTLPEKAEWLIQSIGESNKILRGKKKYEAPLMLGRMIFYGPPGNGKSTMAATIAQRGDAKLFKIHGPSIVGKYLGQAAATIDEIFSDACAHADRYDQVSVIVIDEIDAIAGNNTSELRSEHNSALQKLWLMLDEYKDNHRIYVICTTNNFEQLHQAFIDRFGSNCIEVGNPDVQMRQNVLQHYFNIHAKKCVHTAILEMLAKKTDGLSIRSLEDLARDASLAARMQNEGVVTSAIAKKTLDDIAKKKKAQNKDSYMSLATWRNVVALCNDVTHTARNICFLYGIYTLGSASLSYA
jgi:SpoVK/Ycf46/Vps4 family AAA+-type ATPase